MDCPFTPQIDAYLDGELSPAGRNAVEAHLADCPACAAAWRELNRLRALFAAAPPAAFSDAAVARLHDQADGYYDWGTLRLARIVSGLAASVMIAGALWLNEPRRPTTRPPQWEGAALLLPADLNEPPAGGFAPAEWALSDWSGRSTVEEEWR